MQNQPKDSVPARRVKVSGRRSVYYRELPNGRRRYEITYLDSEGRRRWQVVEGDLKAAEAAREDVRGRMRRGERVAPSKVTFAEVAEAWQATLGELRPSTREDYAGVLRVHVLPRFGRMQVAKITEDHIAILIADMRDAGYKGWTIRAVLVPLGRVLSYAARRGMIAANPITRLERGERPKVERREMRILAREEIGALLDAADESARPLLATAVFSGMRIGELCGVTWANIDFDGGCVKVRKQLDKAGERVEPKTPQAVRDVILMPALARILREHRLRFGFAAEGDFVFPSGRGAGLDQTVARAALKRAMKAAGLDGQDRPPLRFHDLRHTFASLLVAQGENVVFVSRQLGHAGPNITLGVYAHLFDAAEHAERASAALEASFGNLVETATGNGRQNGKPAAGAQVAEIRSAAANGN